MMFWLMFIIAYACIANLAMYMTCREHALTQNRSLIWTLAGVVACVVWPLVIVAMMITAWRKGTVAA